MILGDDHRCPLTSHFSPVSHTRIPNRMLHSYVLAQVSTYGAAHRCECCVAPDHAPQFWRRGLLAN